MRHINLQLIRTACVLAALGMGSAAMAQSMSTTAPERSTAAATSTHNEDALKATPDNRVTAQDRKTPNTMTGKKKSAPGSGPMEPQDKTVNRTDTKQ